MTEQWRGEANLKQIFSKQIAGGNDASFMQLAIPNGTSLLPLRRYIPNLLQSATLQLRALRLTEQHDQLAISAGASKATSAKGDALVGMALPKPRGSSLSKAPVVVAPCMAIYVKNSTCGE